MEQYIETKQTRIGIVLQKNTGGKHQKHMILVFFKYRQVSLISKGKLMVGI